MGCRHNAKTQISINTSLVIPDTKPDIERIIRATSCPIITKVIVIDRKVIFSGHIEIVVEYSACVPCNTQPVHVASFKVPFADFIDHSCARSGQEARISLEIEFQRFHCVNRRTITAMVIFKACVFKLEPARYRAKTVICPPEHITCGAEPVFCQPVPVYDTSECQPCSCVSCDC